MPPDPIRFFLREPAHAVPPTASAPGVAEPPPPASGVSDESVHHGRFGDAPPSGLLLPPGVSDEGVHHGRFGDAPPSGLLLPPGVSDGSVHHGRFGDAPLGRRVRPGPHVLTAAVIEIAHGQEKMISAEQLARCGLDSSAVAKRVDRGVLFAVVPTVYSIVPPPWPWLSRVWAAVLWGGEEGRLSHWTAAQLGALVRPRPGRRIDVTLPTRRRSGPFLDAHWTRQDDPRSVVVIDGFRATTWARTALDLAQKEAVRTVEIVLNNAVVTNVFDLEVLHATIDRAVGHKGRKRTLTALDRLTRASSLTDSQLEEAFLAICDGIGFPRPVTQRGIGNGMRLDFHWPGLGLTVEIDSWRHHRDPDAFHRDREKDLALREQGLEPPLRLTDWMVEHQPQRIARLLVDTRARRGGE